MKADELVHDLEIMPNMSQAVLFAGPSLNPDSKSLIEKTSIDLWPPIKRGDIEYLRKTQNPTHIFIADGEFEQSLSIGHKEIRDAINQNIEIWGLSSMGAIRAFEMRFLGMKGSGLIFDRFFQEIDFQDDEVALLHGPPPLYIKFSEPLIHLRICIDDLVNKKRIALEDGTIIIEILKNRYFGERTLELFSKVIEEVTGIALDQLISNFSSYRQKEVDLVQFIQQKKWIHG